MRLVFLWHQDLQKLTDFALMRSRRGGDNSPGISQAPPTDVMVFGSSLTHAQRARELVEVRMCIFVCRHSIFVFGSVT